jgi:prepilin signal peptidase PulO-like enzyme (type II secretory pathway)
MPAIALIGLLSGGLINFIACLLLRTEDPLSMSAPHEDCPHKQSFWEMIPLLSFFCQTKGCTHCRWRLFVEYPFIEIVTAATFITLAWHFHFTLFSYGMMIFSSILIAVCITDFKTKIIPHEITYPSIIVGIIFSAQVRSDLLGAMAGIGMSYIFFDFLAFYGLHFYVWLNKPTPAPSEQLLSLNETSKFNLSSQSFWSSKEPIEKSILKNQPVPSISSGLFCKGTPLEEFEVIGGGDAVLAALISAWLGYQKLISTVIISLLVGSALGALYLLVELWRQRLMSILVIPVTAGGIIGAVLSMFMLTLTARAIQQPFSNMPYLWVLFGAVLAGSLVGVIVAGSKLSKPFPFGPALAAGAMVSIFT